MMNQDEYDMQVAIADYLSLKHPDVDFRSDLGGIKLTIGQAVKVKKIQKDKSWPDFFIAEPRKGFCGLFLELKKNYEEIYTKAGNFKKNKHIKRQKNMLNRLNKKGYLALFVCGIDNAIQTIDKYLK